MKILKTIIFTILYNIGLIILAVIIALGTLFTYSFLQVFLFGRGDYLLFISDEFNMVPILMLMIYIIVYIIVIKQKKIEKKIENQSEIIKIYEEPIEVETPSKLEQFVYKLFSNEKLLNKLDVFSDKILKKFKVIKICFISVLVIAIYCGMTSYAILYSDRVKVSTPINPIGAIYEYNDIKSIDVGVKKEKRNSYIPYYKVKFSDDRSVDLFGGSMMHEDKGKSFEYILIDLDKELISQRVSKNVNKVNFKDYSKDLDKDFISRVEKLFDDK